MARAGRKRKQNVSRVNGRISQRQTDVQRRRQETEMEATETARMARIRVFGITAEDAMNPDTATVVGRLKRAGVINAGQLMAAHRYEACVASYRAAIAAPRDRVGSDLNGVGGVSPVPEDEARYIRTRDRYFAAIRAVLDENGLHKNRGGNLPGALDAIVLRDIDVPHLHGDLRLALNALSHYFGCAEEETSEEAA